MTLAELVAVPRETRDEAWVEAFYAAVPDAPVREGEPHVGPDGYPYATLLVAEPAAVPVAPPAATTLREVLGRCLDEGRGAVVMTASPEWVFPYGNLWSFQAYGRFVLPFEQGSGPGGQILVGSPSDELLPPYARAVLRRALESQGAKDPGVLVVDQAGGSPPRSFAFDPMPDPRRLLWYLPPHLGLVSVMEGWPDPMPL